MSSLGFLEFCNGIRMIHGIGIDTIEVSRFARAMTRWGERLEKRLFTATELDYCLKQRSPERHLSARFAAKVSFFKALGRALPYKDVEVAKDPSGAPVISAKGLPPGLKVNISISHDGDLSIAETIIESD